MAERHWVGGTASWSAIAGTKWALTNGGVGGEAVPTASDDVYFDSGSGTCTVTISASSVCLSLNKTSANVTIAGSSALAISASATWIAPWTYTGAITFNSTTTGNTITNNGLALSSAITFNGVSGVWTLADALNTTGVITLTNGTFDDGGFQVTCDSRSSNNNNVRSWIKTGNLILTGTGTVSTFGATLGNLTLSDTTGTTSLTNSSATARTYNAGNGLTYNNLSITAGTGTVTISNSDATTSFNSVDWTGFAGSYIGTTNFSFRGDLTWASGMTSTDINIQLYAAGTSGTQTITSNGMVWNKAFAITTSGSTVSLADNLDLGTRNLSFVSGYFTDNNNNISAVRIFNTSTSTRTVTGGSGTWTMTTSGTTPYTSLGSSNLTWTAPAVMKVTDTGGTRHGFFTQTTSDSVFNQIWFSGSNSGGYVINSSVSGITFSIGSLKLDAPNRIEFGEGRTFNIGSIIGLSGTAGNLTTLASAVGGSQYTLIKSGAVFNGDYLNVTDMIGGDGYKWFMGKNSVNGGNNKGVAFTTSTDAADFI